LGALKPGEFRYLSAEELHKLRRAVRGGTKGPKAQEAV
jgi:hypothetical protein